MAPRRAPTCTGTATSANRGRARGGIRKNTRYCQPPSRYGQQERDTETPIAQSEGSNESLNPSEGVPTTPSERAASSPQYSLSPRSYAHRHGSTLTSSSNTLPRVRAPASASVPSSSHTSPPPQNTPINLSTMRELLRPHEQDIVDRVVLQLQSQNTRLANPHHTSPVSPQTTAANPLPQELSPDLRRILNLETQLAQLRGEMESRQ